MGNQTKLRYIASRDPKKIVKYVNELIPYKIEIKGSPVLNNKKWFLWFNLPDKPIQEIYFGDLDKKRG